MIAWDAPSSRSALRSSTSKEATSASRKDSISTDTGLRRSPRATPGRSTTTSPLGLAPPVSLTDHDGIEAPITLRILDTFRDLPVSVEWTVPFKETFFHLGVHDLPPDGGVRNVRNWRNSPRRSGAASGTDGGARIEPGHPILLTTLSGREIIGRGTVPVLRGRVLPPRYDRWLHADGNENGLRPWKEESGRDRAGRADWQAGNLGRRPSRARAQHRPQPDKVDVQRVAPGNPSGASEVFV